MHFTGGAAVRGDLLDAIEESACHPQSPEKASR